MTELNYATILVVLFILILFLSLALAFFNNQKASKIKELNDEIERFKNKIGRLNKELLKSKEEYNNLESLTTGTSFVREQIRKINSLEIQAQKQNKVINETMKIAQEATQIKSDFLINVKTGIDTPINSMLSFSKVLSKELKDTKSLTLLKNIFRLGQQALAALEKAIEVAKLESEHFEMNERTINTKEFFEAILEEEKYLAQKKGLEFTMEIDERMPISIITDDLKVKDILTNLIQNAIKFTDKGYVKVKIITEVVDVRKNIFNLTMSVEDSGISIDGENQEKIFEIFNNKDNSFKRQESALGLSLDRKMARAMNGDLMLKSEPLKGCIFAFVLHDVEIELSNFNDEFDENELDFSLVKPDGANVMILEENIESRNIIMDSFLNTSVNTFMYDNPREAIEALKTKKFDMIFIDVEVLCLDDSAVSKFIAKISSAFVISLTSTSLKSVKFAQNGANIVGYLKKPICKAQLLKISISTLNS